MEQDLLEEESSDERFRRWSEFSDSVFGLQELTSDREKLVGHLLLAHQSDAGILRLDIVGLIRLHAPMLTARCVLDAP